MKTEYLKKTRFFKLAKLIIDDDFRGTSLGDCDYKCYRGNEWLDTYSCDFFYELSRMGNVVMVYKYYFDEDFNKIEVEYSCFSIKLNSFIDTGILCITDRYVRN